MIIRYALPIVAVAMLGFASFSVLNARQDRPRQEAPRTPPQSPFETTVAAVGLVEPSSELIQVGTHLAGVVAAVFVKTGEVVAVDAPLFQLDDRDARAGLRVGEARLAVSEEKLAELAAYPRAEDLPPAEAQVAAGDAAVAEALTDRENRQRQLRIVREMAKRDAASPDELDNNVDAARLAESRWELARARADEARAGLARLRAGTFEPLLATARAEVEAARAEVEAARTTVERLTVRSPVSGQVLKLDVRVGEFAQAGALATPLVIMGVVTPLHVRADVDETDATRVRAGAAARARIRGDAERSAPLEFVRFEPYVIPKRSLTGGASERTDTRVLQVIYRLDPTALDAYVGQQVDVFIEERGEAGGSGS